MSLDRTSDEPAYRQIARELALTIATRGAQDRRLPTERDLMAQYGVSRITIRQAMEVLNRQNLIVRRRAKGTFARPTHVTQDLASLGSFYKSLSDLGLQFRTELLAFRRVRAPKEVARVLQSQHVLKLVRKYVVGDAPLALAEAYLHPVAFGITRLQAERQYTLSLFENALGIKLGHSDLSIRADLPRSDLPAVLETKRSEAILILERTVYSIDDQPLEFSTFFLRSKAYELRLRLSGGVRYEERIHPTD